MAERVAEDSHVLSSNSSSDWQKFACQNTLSPRNPYEGSAHRTSGPDQQVEQAHRAKCESYQARLKDYHDARCHAALHDFKVGDPVFCANVRPGKLDSKFQSAEHVIFKVQGRDTFGVVNVVTGATLSLSEREISQSMCQFRVQKLPRN